MATLTTAQRDAIAAEVMEALSRTRTPIDINKVQLRAMINVFDTGLEAAETSILNGVSAAARTWLLANQTVARYVLEEVAEQRREVL